LGCSNGNLLRQLLEERQFTEIVGLDVLAPGRWEIAAARLKLDRLPQRPASPSSCMARSRTGTNGLAGYDTAALVEVIEHLDPPRLAALERDCVSSFAPPEERLS